MNYEQIHSLFKQSYNQSSWKQFLTEAFVKTRLLAKPEILTGIDVNVASQVQKLGFVTLDEKGIERQIAVYEVTLAEGIILERNRVGLRNLLRKYWKDIDAAFIVYHLQGVPNWRFTYVSELAGYNPEGDYVKIKTEPKRYTYVLGEGESTRTAAERFTTIANKGSKTTLDDVKEAFSVEKLSKAFFDEYTKHYDIFCDFMVSKPNICQTIFNGDKKAIRDFNKKFLGRIVFLYFIQKKGWLGVPLKEDWGNGDFNFLTKQFENFRNKDLFYKDFLSVLFFETLNTKRKDDIFNFDNAQFILKNTSLVKIPFLSGGLFDEDEKKHRGIMFPANLLKSLFDFFNQYNFTIYEDSPNDHTVAVDPEMLGHIFENLLEDNKDKGAFYTPKEIVHYMCQESLIEYLTTWFENKGYEVVGYIGFDKTDQAKLFSVNEGRKGQLIIEADTKGIGKQIDRLLIEKLLKKKLDDDDKKLIKKHAAEFHIALDTVKICDPAIGSGAFPMGLLHEIFTAKQTLHTFENGNTKTFNASAVKLNIIQNSIYGVDIEKGAVDIARLRFWLSLIVDENKPQALPNLDYKIVVGNSLVNKLGEEVINIDWTLNETSHGLFGANLAKQKGDLLKKISKEQIEFFKPNSDKKKLAADIRNLKIDLLITQLELMVKVTNQETQPKAISYKDKKKFVKATLLFYQTIAWKKSILNLQKLKNKPDAPLQFFDWKLDFPEVMNEFVANNTGFDIVIGNPPYIQLQKMVGSEVFENLNYSTYSKSSDIYCLFYEKGINILKERGNLCFITSNSWLKTKYGLELRKFFIENSNPLALINFDGVQVFESAVVESNILLTKKCDYDKSLKALILDNNFLKGSDISSHFLNSYIKLNDLDINGWILGTGASLSIKSKIEQNSIPLKELNLSMDYGIKTGFNKAFIIDSDKKKELINLDKNASKIIKPVLRGRDIKKYKCSFSDLYIITTFPSLKLDIDNFVSIKKHLLSFGKNRLEQSGNVGSRKKTGNKWYETQDQISYHENFSKEKLIWIELSDKAGFYLDSDNYYPLAGTWVMTGENLRYLIAILNSKLGEWYFNQISTSSGMGTSMWKKYKVELLPIKKAKKSEIKYIEKIVNQIIDNKSKLKDTSDLEQKIDNIIYKLYELTFDEIKIIVPEFSLSKNEYETIKLE